LRIGAGMASHSEDPTLWHVQCRMPKSAPAPYATLTPDRILDALDSVGLRGDGRLLALNSYENRVYLANLEDATSVVAKFYRP